MKKAVITGTGRRLPDRVVSNDDLAKLVDTSDEWIRSRTGIVERRISTGENTSDLAAGAALDAMKNAGVSPESIDMIVCATVTPDGYFPSTSCLIQKKIGAVNASCMDLSAACSGFIYSLNVVTQMIRTGVVKRAVVIGAETLSKACDWTDRGTCVLFGDGAGAVVLEEGDADGVIYSVTGADGSRSHVLTSYALPVKNPFLTDAPEAGSSAIYMDGREVFKFATRIIPDIIEDILAKNNLTINDIHHIVPHQANYRIIESAAERFGIEKERFYMNLDRYGNTSAASIPIALAEMNEKGLLKKGELVIIAGFGGGLTWGGSLIRWN